MLFHLVGGALIADTLTDFSEHQGFNGWNYNYNDSLSVKPFQNYEDSWISDAMSWQIVDSWCQISKDVIHPTTDGNIDNCNTPIGYCAPIINWNNSSPEQNLIVSLTASHTTSLTTSRDGVILILKINEQVEESFTTPFTVSKSYGPYNISSIDLILDPKSTCNNDGTHYRIQIYAPDPSPSSTTTTSPTATVSTTPSGVCHTIRNQLFGIKETVTSGVTFTVLHGYNVTHSEPYQTCGFNPVCEELGAICSCTYTGGSSAMGCPNPRTTTITYSLSDTNSLSYNGEYPMCAYHMTRNYMIPSVSSTVSNTQSHTPTASFTPSASATGICNEINNYINGQIEVIYDNTTRYNLFHGRYITTPHLENFDILIGIFNGCTEYSDYCLCNYDNGYNIGCENQRKAIVNFTNGAVRQTSYYNHSNCVFMFNASYIRPSITPTSSKSATMTGTRTSSVTSSDTYTSTKTKTATNTETETSTPTTTASWTVSPTKTSTYTSTQSGTETKSSTITITPTSSATGICNDVYNYVFGRTDNPTKDYTIIHGDKMTHFYYPRNYILIGKTPSCTDYGDVCICVYEGGDSSLCSTNRKGVVIYSYNNNYKTVLVNYTNPVCVYQFNTTFFLPYLSPTASKTSAPSITPSQTASATASATYIQKFKNNGVSFLNIPKNFPAIPTYASHKELASIADSFVNSLTLGTSGTEDLIDTLGVLASSLSAVSGNLSLELSGPGFMWKMTPASKAVPISAGNISVVLPALENGIVYSFIASTPIDNSSLPSFSVDAMGSTNNRYKISGLSTPLVFQIDTVPPNGTVLECVYWNGSTWETDGCMFTNKSCVCTHFTEFSARFAAIRDVNTDMFSRAGEVYSISGLKKYAAIYSVIIGLFIGICGVFILLLYLDNQGEKKYRTAVEDIDEVCKVLGYNKPLVSQPQIVLPIPNATNCIKRFCSACCTRIVYQHSYFGILFKYDPRLPRGFRLLLVSSVAFHTLFLSVLLYGYTKVAAEMTIIESITLSVITSALNIPFIRICVLFINAIGIYEYTARFPDFTYEYNRRRAFETALQHTHTSEILRIIRRLKAGKTVSYAIQSSPVGHRMHHRENIEHSDGDIYGETSTDAVIGVLLERCFTCRKRSGPKADSIHNAIEIAQSNDPHFSTPICNTCPTKTFYGFVFSCAALSYIIWIMNYLLLFTASQSSSTMNNIASSFGISQATSILLTQPLTIFLTLLGSWLLSKCRKNSTNHIGYFVDPSFHKNSTSLSGNWAYWIFLYGGSMSSLGFNSIGRPLGYSSTKVALEWVNGNHTLNISVRDSAITTLYVYLRGIENPLTERVAAGAKELKTLLEVAPCSTIVPVEKPTDEEALELTTIVNEIETHSKDGRLSIVPKSARDGGTH